MQPQPIGSVATGKRKPARRMGVLLLVGLGLCAAAFIASFIIIVMYVGGG
jgi:hypothetical protein